MRNMEYKWNKYPTIGTHIINKINQFLLLIWLGLQFVKLGFWSIFLTEGHSCYLHHYP